MNADAMPPDADDLSLRGGWDDVAALLGLLVVELFLLQIFAVGVATGIYHLAPLLEVGRPQGFEDWLKLFQVVGPTLTLPGGSAIVLTVWLMARRARRAERMAEVVSEQLAAERVKTSEAQTQAAEARAQASEAQATIADLRAEVERLRGQS